MKKKFALLCGLTMAMAASAQDAPGTGLVFDAREDTTNVVTITDIIAAQELVTSTLSTDAHFNKVWSYNSYFNLGYNTEATLTPQESILSGLYNTQYVQPFKSDWGASLTLGHNYRLHKRAIANILQFNLDYTYINLHANHFKAATDEADENGKLYNSATTHIEQEYENGIAQDITYNNIPWNLEKYEFNFSMQLGPSITLAPFTYVNYRPLHFLKFNVYYHVGYEASLMLICNDKKKPSDANPEINSIAYEKMKSPSQTWGHGLTTTFGFSMNWKSIGIGYETSECKLDYQSLQTDLFGYNKYKFKNKTARVYLQIRY